MIFRNLIFQPEVVKQRLPAGMVSHHEQQASKWNGEQQHGVLWPAYNPNIAPPQAPTEGLFQQTPALSLIENWRGWICVVAFLSNNRSVTGARMIAAVGPTVVRAAHA